MLEKIIKSILEEKNHSPKTSFYTKTQSRLLKELNKSNLKSKKKKLPIYQKLEKLFFLIIPWEPLTLYIYLD